MRRRKPHVQDFLAYVYVSEAAKGFSNSVYFVKNHYFCLFSIYNRAGMVFYSDFHAQNKTMMSKWNS